MSISGLPPFNGFFSKLIIIIAAISGRFYLLATLAVIVSIITLAYFLKFQRYAFYNKAAETATQKIKEVPFPMSFSMIFLAALCLALSLLAFPSVSETILSPAIDALIQPEIYSTTILGL